MLEKIIFVSLIIILLWSPLPFGSVEGWSNGILQVASIVLALALTIKNIWTKKTFSYSPIQIPFLLLLIQGLAQYFFVSYDPYQTKLALFSWLSMSLFFWLGIETIHSGERLKKVINALIMLATLLSIEAIAQYLTANNKIYWFKEIPDATPFGPFVNRNHYAGFMELLIPLPMSLFLSKKTPSHWKNFYLLSTITICISLLASSSRAGLLCLIIEVFLLLFITKITSSKENLSSFNLKKTAVLISILLISLVVTKAISQDWVIFRLKEFNSSLGIDSNLTRTSIWGNSLLLFYDHPILGVGLGAYSTAYTLYDSSNGYLRIEQTHNDYIQILTDLGILGGFYLCMFLFFFFKNSVKNIFGHSVNNLYIDYQIGAFVGCCTMLIHSFVDFNLQIPSNVLLFLILCVCTLHYFVRLDNMPNIANNNYPNKNL